MDFESPDVEKCFPGLYASESVKKCNENNFSDESHDKNFKKDLIIGKRKEKKDSKKDRGYAALEGESSPEEDKDTRSCKSKKTKSFKFSTKKTEKREKSKEKDVEKKDKEKKEKEKEKIKSKEKKKIKYGDEALELTENYNIFGVSLSTAVERNGSLDGVPIPVIVRNCIDCIHNFGLSTDGLYKIIGMKSKVQALRKMYNAREHVSLSESDVPVATCLLKMFLKELPEPLLTYDLLTRFEEAGAIMEVKSRERELKNLITQLPTENKVLLGWLIIHFDTVTMHEKQNKLNAQSIAMTFSPVLQMSHRLLTAFLCHCKPLFPDIVIERYIPPLCPGSSFPEDPAEIALELKKQEFLLNQLHKEMSEGFVSKKKEELLWEVQRIVTQLKRKLRSLQKSQESNAIHRSLEEESKLNLENISETTVQRERGGGEKNDSQSKRKNSKENSDEIVKNAEGTVGKVEDKSSETDSNETDKSPVKSSPEKQPPPPDSSLKCPKDGDLESLRSRLEHEELLKFQISLKNRIDREKELISELMEKIQIYGNRSPPPRASPEVEVSIEKLEKDYQTLQILQLLPLLHRREKNEPNLIAQKNNVKDLTERIFEERLACIKLKVYVDILTLPEKES